jgi:hypothetical protein
MDLAAIRSKIAAAADKAIKDEVAPISQELNNSSYLLHGRMLLQLQSSLLTLFMWLLLFL